MAPRSHVPAVFVLALAASVAACSGSRSAVSAPPTTLAPYVMAQGPSPCDVPVVLAPASPCTVPTAEAMPLPPDADPGEVWCYIRVPAVTQTVSEQVLVSAATCREEWVPPVTEEVTEQVLVKCEERLKIPVAAEFEERVEQVLICDAKTEWRKVDCLPKALNQGEQVGECWTLVQIPPQYTPRTTRVCIKPESCREEVIAAEYAPRTRTVTVQEGFMKKVPVPAVFDVRTREVEVSPAHWEWRRTSECEVPEVAAGATPEQPTLVPPAVEQPAGVPSDLPPAGVPPAPEPAGELPPAPVVETPPAPAPEPAAQPAIPEAPAFDAPPAGTLPPLPAEIPPVPVDVPPTPSDVPPAK